MLRPLSELIDVKDPGWPLVQSWVNKSELCVDVLPSNENQRDAELLFLEISTRSILGAVAYESGGIIIDNGWLRILGNGHKRLSRTVQSWNKAASKIAGKALGPLLVADDVIGGFFAIDFAGKD